MSNVSKEVIGSLFDYKDGGLYWKLKSRRRIVLGERAGAINTYGYRVIRLNGKRIGEHRLIWMLFNGDIPPKTEIDHRDTNKLNNRIENLRLATRRQNLWNRAVSVKSTSGYKGVYWKPQNGKWAAVLGYNKKQINIGLFETKELAAIAYNEQAKKIHGEFANLNIIPQ